jgi:hypothetical protein
MKHQIARLFGVIVKFDGGVYLYTPEGKYIPLKE